MICQHCKDTGLLDQSIATKFENLLGQMGAVIGQKSPHDEARTCPHCPVGAYQKSLLQPKPAAARPTV